MDSLWAGWSVVWTAAKMEGPREAPKAVYSVALKAERTVAGWAESMAERLVASLVSM